MPRPRRVQIAGAAYHITARGNNGEVTFRDAEDFRLYLRLLAGLRKRAGIRILAYTLMSNHVHLVVVTTAENLSRAVQWLHGISNLRMRPSAADLQPEAVPSST